MTLGVIDVTPGVATSSADSDQQMALVTERERQLGSGWSVSRAGTATQGLSRGKRAGVAVAEVVMPIEQAMARMVEDQDVALLGLYFLGREPGLRYLGSVRLLIMIGRARGMARGEGDLHLGRGVRVMRRTRVGHAAKAERA
jgi:hypothetical protein